MTKMQLKAMFMYGWNAYGYALTEQEIYTSISPEKLEEAFDELIQRDYIAELMTENEPD
jgi:hypothetical protein